MKSTRWAQQAILTLLIVGAITQGVIYFTYHSVPAQGFPNGDALDYVPPAKYLWEHGKLPKEPNSFRPPGYSILLAPLFIFGETDGAITKSAVMLNFIIDRIALIYLFARFIYRRGPSWLQAIFAIIFLLQPWTNASGNRIVPDTVVMLLMVLGIDALSQGLKANKQNTVVWLAAASLAISSTFLLRPEMVLFSALLIFCTWRLGQWPLKRGLRYVAIMTLPLVFMCAINLSHRSYLDGKPTLIKRPTLSHTGVRRWQRTWAGRQCFVYLL